MIEIGNLITPSPEWWETAIFGMRNAFKSWDKGDSYICREVTSIWDREISCPGCGEKENCEAFGTHADVFILGKSDKKLLLGLTAEGDPSHRKVLRQLPVIMDITAPLYWWKQMDQYKVGTVTNSESTMHTLTKEPFKLSDFSTDSGMAMDFNTETRITGYLGKECCLQLNGKDITTGNWLKHLINDALNPLRTAYLKTKQLYYWDAINHLIPQSYNQKRTWSANYEVLLTIMAQRIDHKLVEWNELITCWLKEVPYLLDLAVAAKIVVIKDGAVCYQDKKHPDEYHKLYRID